MSPLTQHNLSTFPSKELMTVYNMPMLAGLNLKKNPKNCISCCQHLRTLNWGLQRMAQQDTIIDDALCSTIWVEWNGYSLWFVAKAGSRFLRVGRAASDWCGVLKHHLVQSVRRGSAMSYHLGVFGSSQRGSKANCDRCSLPVLAWYLLWAPL